MKKHKGKGAPSKDNPTFGGGEAEGRKQGRKSKKGGRKKGRY